MNKTVFEIQKRMVEQGLTLATAESCTSGGIAREITKVAGSSDYFQGGLVAYQPSVHRPPGRGFEGLCRLRRPRGRARLRGKGVGGEG